MTFIAALFKVGKGERLSVIFGCFKSDPQPLYFSATSLSLRVFLNSFIYEFDSEGRREGDWTREKGK